jgi:hypothetical protein
VGAHVRELLHHDRVVEEVAACAAVFLGCVAPEEAFLAHAPPRLAVAHALLVPVGDLGLDLRLGEADELLAEELVLVAEDVALHGPHSRSFGVGSPAARMR